MGTKSEGKKVSASIKTEIARPPRLQSFKVPRDLSLGGSSSSPAAAAASNKKQFTPNLKVTRNKIAATTSDSTATTKNGRNAKNQGRGDRGRGRGGQAEGRGRGCIQSIGLFSEGIAGQPLRRTSQARPSYNEANTSPQVRRPTLVKAQKFDEDMEKQSLSDFMKDEEGDMGLTALTVEDNFSVPVVLQEPQTRTVVVDEGKEYPDTLQSLFQRTTPQLFLIQLPDTLPGPGNEVVDTKKSDGEEGTDPNDGLGGNNFCLMKGLQEGLAGKFIRYRSGKTKLVLGNTRFDVDLGLQPGFLQEVMSVKTNSSERSGDMINLGKISAKVNVSPDWEDIMYGTN